MRTDRAKVKVIPLARIRGRFMMRNPYMVQSRTPVVNKKYMKKDMSPVFLVLKDLMACGRKDMVVLAAAKKPRAIIQSMIIENQGS